MSGPHAGEWAADAPTAARSHITHRMAVMTSEFTFTVGKLAVETVSISFHILKSLLGRCKAQS